MMNIPPGIQHKVAADVASVHQAVAQSATDQFTDRAQHPYPKTKTPVEQAREEERERSRAFASEAQLLREMARSSHGQAYIPSYECNEIEPHTLEIAKAPEPPELSIQVPEQGTTAVQTLRLDADVCCTCCHSLLSAIWLKFCSNDSMNCTSCTSFNSWTLFNLPLATRVVCLLSLASYIVCTTINLNTPYGTTWWYSMACARPTAILHFQVWRLFTSPFFHSSLANLVVNMVLMLSHGRWLERLMGTLQYAWAVTWLALLGTSLHSVMALATDVVLLAFWSMHSNDNDSVEAEWRREPETSRCSIGLSGVTLGLVVMELKARGTPLTIGRVVVPPILYVGLWMVIISGSTPRNLHVDTYLGHLGCVFPLSIRKLHVDTYLGHLGGLLAGLLLCHSSAVRDALFLSQSSIHSMQVRYLGHLGTLEQATGQYGNAYVAPLRGNPFEPGLNYGAIETTNDLRLIHIDDMLSGP
ncbi:hypothetical protein CYMTET_21520 [Cymbomonas tetramitiformis]|uniref:Peptidase S54 rhomboid domain-containing protein n=1 Tax=Cymbomonas tetramitiformis TaxID=36881 RepID=A0AAE0G1Q4_9CHLO|nr:hypothetical protein CYMTET_21520 [Cymbomonas tetramitiformis]